MSFRDDNSLWVFFLNYFKIFLNKKKKNEIIRTKIKISLIITLLKNHEIFPIICWLFLTIDS